MGLELPEIINLSQQMDKTLKNKIIKEINLDERSKSLIKQGMCNLDRRGDEILNSPIKSIKSRGKWIFIEFNNEKYLILGEVIGKFQYYPDLSDLPSKYHVIFEFEDKSALTFQSSLYAFIMALSLEEIENHKYAGNIGPSPLDKEFTYPYFLKFLSKYENRAIKGVLNLQSEISGLGNAYINDILYHAKIHPKAKVSSLKDSQRRNLYDTIMERMNSATKLGGSVKEYNLFGEKGGYTRLADQPLKDLKCNSCGFKIEKMNVSGSASYICPQCQEL